MSSVARKEVLKQLPSWIIRDRYRNATTEKERLQFREEFNSRHFEGLNNTENGDSFRVDTVAEWICRSPESIIEEAAAHGGLVARDGRHNLTFSPVMISGDEARRQAAAAKAEDAEPEPEFRARRVKVTLELPEYLVIGYRIAAKNSDFCKYLVDLLDGNTFAAPRGLCNDLDAETLLELESKHPGFVEAASWDDGHVNVWPELVRQQVRESKVVRIDPPAVRHA